MSDHDEFVESWTRRANPTYSDTQPNVGVEVPGILAKGTYNGTEVNLLPYFNGDLASSNRGGSMGVSVNFRKFPERH